jgi:hypothetical protein
VYRPNTHVLQIQLGDVISLKVSRFSGKFWIFLKAWVTLPGA